MPTFAVLVIDHQGEQQYIRDGADAGRGPVATWRSRSRAEAQAEFWREGLGDDVASVTVVRYHRREVGEQP